MSWVQGLRPCEALGPTCVVDWGTVIAAVVGVVTVGVAVLAWLTSRRAAQIADEATKIAQLQHDEGKRVRMATARITGRLLLHEINNLPPRLGHLSKLLGSVAVDDTYTRPSGFEVLSVAQALSRPLLPNAERVEERIHNLPNHIGADLATLISHSRDIAAAAQRIEENVRTTEPAMQGHRRTYHYIGEQGELVRLLTYLNFVLDLATEFRPNFREFVLSDGAGESLGGDDLSPK